MSLLTPTDDSSLGFVLSYIILEKAKKNSFKINNILKIYMIILIFFSWNMENFANDCSVGILKGYFYLTDGH